LTQGQIRYLTDLETQNLNPPSVPWWLRQWWQSLSSLQNPHLDPSMTKKEKWVEETRIHAIPTRHRGGVTHVSYMPPTKTGLDLFFPPIVLKPCRSTRSR